jgi:hypothetical protein
MLFNVISELSAARKIAGSFESKLDSARRKHLGQFFTGLPLSRILAAISVKNNCTSVIDPMAGHGDLLDAVFERCSINGIQLSRVDAIEIDPATAQVCQNRLRPWLDINKNLDNISVHESSAFEPSLMCNLKRSGYDLVITNPPYVRYQTITNNGWMGNRDAIDKIREALITIVSERIPKREQHIWRKLVQGYSGLSDLSVPAWLLAAMLVKPKGTLALVAPATWRTRDYADVLQYLLARCFRVDLVIADRQPGWFSKVLVRTHLIVATRLTAEHILKPLCSRRPVTNEVVWGEVDQTAKKGGSLVGAVFDKDDPEGKFAQWLLNDESETGIPAKSIFRKKYLEDGISNILSVNRSLSWLRHLEPLAEKSPLFSSHHDSARAKIPRELKDIMPTDCEINLHSLSKTGISVGQGLRTGCNGFFYVELLKKLDEKSARIRVSDILGGHETVVPIDALKPVLRRQSEIEDFRQGSETSGYVLDLRGYVLPEDSEKVKNARYIYKILGIDPPRKMPQALANLVRRAAQTQYNPKRSKKYIPELSAVHTNARESSPGSNPKTPRFWYMLPDFVKRHLPDAFVPRVNQDTPWVLANRTPPILIDANFSTIWAKGPPWTPDSVVRVMNSVWARTCMEAIGTPLGGGALKLEATHLRRLLIPEFSHNEVEQIAKIDQYVMTQPGMAKLTKIDHIVINAILNRKYDVDYVDNIISKMYRLMEKLMKARQRG